METKIFGYERMTWTGGDSPSKEVKRVKDFQKLRSFFFRESLDLCGGLDLWKCAGTSSMERARIFWRHANYDAWATYRNSFNKVGWRG